MSGYLKTWNCGAEGRWMQGSSCGSFPLKAAVVAAGDGPGRSREKDNPMGGQTLGEQPGAGQVTRWASRWLLPLPVWWNVPRVQSAGMALVPTELTLSSLWVSQAAQAA